MSLRFGRRLGPSRLRPIGIEETGMPRFVVLEHRSPRGLHWDFMLEAGPVLTTWELAQPPDAGLPIPATRLPDHRRDYLDYEGPISGGRGEVRRWDGGTYETRHDTERRRVLALSGQKLAGTVIFTASRDQPGQWLVSFGPGQPPPPPPDPDTWVEPLR